jgi:hypothetical protein
VNVAFTWKALTDGSQHLIGEGAGTNPYPTYHALIWHNQRAENLTWKGTVSPDGTRTAIGSTISGRLHVASIGCTGGRAAGNVFVTGGPDSTYYADLAEESFRGNVAAALAAVAYFRIPFEVELADRSQVLEAPADPDYCGAISKEDISLQLTAAARGPGGPWMGRPKNIEEK